MGKSEGELLEEMVRTTMNLCDKELRARERLLKEKKLPLRDACLRAYGLLTNCAMLSQNELTDGMVKLKLGMALGFFKARDIHAFNDFLADMRPASFRLENNLRGATERECSIARAEIVGQVLPELMLRID
jgi:protein-arginine kinase